MAKNNQNPVSETDTNNATATAAPPAKSVYEGCTHFIYVGPSLPNGALRGNAVFRGTYAEITEYLKDALTKFPKAAKLIVPIEKLAEVNGKVEVPGNLLYNYYQEIATAIRTKGDEK